MLLAILIGLIGVLLVPPVAAQERSRCFAETNQCIDEPFLSYWEQHGGLPVFGYPISAVTTASLYDPVSGEFWWLPVQWFERDRLEDHRFRGLGVLAGRLGAELLEAQGRPWQRFQKSTPDPNCRFFPETGQNLCQPFLRYWQANGGLERFGFPLSAPQTELVEGRPYTVQWFERRRMELHHEYAGTPILLGLLGLALYPELGCFEAGPPLQRMSFVYRPALGCPLPVAGQHTSASQTFERGTMLQIDGIGSRLTPLVYMLFYDQQQSSLIYERFTYQDWWHASDAITTPPPAGLYPPERTFARLWNRYPRVRYTLGWASTPMHNGEVWRQVFEHGQMVYPLGSDGVYIFFPDSRAAFVPLLE